MKVNKDKKVKVIHDGRKNVIKKSSNVIVKKMKLLSDQCKKMISHEENVTEKHTNSILKQHKALPDQLKTEGIHGKNVTKKDTNGIVTQKKLLPNKQKNGQNEESVIKKKTRPIGIMTQKKLLPKQLKKHLRDENVTKKNTNGIVRQKKMLSDEPKKKRLHRKNVTEDNTNGIMTQKNLLPDQQKKTLLRFKRAKRGVVYLSHIPHGFYEDQIKAYFSQFGDVTGIKLPRSREGRSKGYAFIEFKHPDVAKIAADTMNNYLMYNRVLKTKYIPPKQQKQHILRIEEMKGLKSLKEKSLENIKLNRNLKNKALEDSEVEIAKALKLKKRQQKLKEKLNTLGISYNFGVEQGNINEVLRKQGK